MTRTRRNRVHDQCLIVFRRTGVLRLTEQEFRAAQRQFGADRRTERQRVREAGFASANTGRPAPSQDNQSATCPSWCRFRKVQAAARKIPTYPEKIGQLTTWLHAAMAVALTAQKYNHLAKHWDRLKPAAPHERGPMHVLGGDRVLNYYLERLFLWSILRGEVVAWPERRTAAADVATHYHFLWPEVGGDVQLRTRLAQHAAPSDDAADDTAAWIKSQDGPLLPRKTVLTYLSRLPY